LEKNIIPIFKKGKQEDPGKYRPVSLTSSPGNMMEQLTPKTISRPTKDKKDVRSDQHGFTKKPCLTSPITFYDEMSGLADEEKAVDIFCLDSVRRLTLSPIRSS